VKDILVVITLALVLGVVLAVDIKINEWRNDE
jgi:hypothetical protein